MLLDPASNAAQSWCLEALLEALGASEEAPAQEQTSPDPAPCGDPFAGFGPLHAVLSALQQAAIAPPQEQGTDAAAADRQQQAQQLSEQGGLNSPAVQPPPTQKELDDLAARVNAADDDAAVQIANDPRAMAIATPQQKAALARKLMDGHTNGEEEQAIKKIMLSCTSREELDKVIEMSGGWGELEDELDDGDLRQIGDHGARLTQRQDAAVQIAITLLEQAQSPEEFERLYKQLGGDQLKYKLPRPPSVDTLGRLEALGQKYGIAGVGFGMPPEKTIALQAAIQKAIDEEDNDAIVQLSENGEAMKAASPAQKARMIRILQDGWTKDCQDMALARILTSCGSKAEFDQVVDMAGGPAILDDVDFEQAKADINKVMGGFDRIDCADDKATAQAYKGALMPPQVDELSRTRPPTDAELGAVLGPQPASSRDDADTQGRIDEVRVRMGRAAHDVQADPLARNKLALVNRERQINGQPPLDYTTLVTRAYQVANDPSFEDEVDRAVADAEKRFGKLDSAGRQEIREKLLAQRLGALAKEYGLSEQDMKTLVTAKMGRVLQEGAVWVRSLSNDPATRAWADRLQVTGATAASLFKVPPSFAEDLVAALSVIGDVLAAVVNVIPGVGQAISGAYFGVKAIVGLANGDVLGAFKSLLSAVPGFSGIFGAASAAINTGAKVVQAGIAAGEGIASGNPLAFAGAVGSMAGNLGVDLNKFVPADEVVQGAVRQGMAVGNLIDGVAHGDFGAVLGVALPDQLRALGAGALADKLDTIGASPAAQAFRETAERAGQFVGALGGGDAAAVGAALRAWMPQLGAHSASRAIVGLGDQALRLLGSRELYDAIRQGYDEAHEVKRVLQQLSALKPQADDVRRFEDAAIRLRPLGNGDWQALGAELLRRFGVQ
jgi:hypothetical protein